MNVLKKEEFGSRKISDICISDAKLWLIQMQKSGRGYSSIHTIRGVLRLAFQMAVDDDVLLKNPFEFQLATVVINDSIRREAITKEQMRKFLKFVHDDNVYCKYYEVFYILFHTGLRISETSKWQAKDKEETRSIEFYTLENPLEPTENTSTNIWLMENRNSSTVGDWFRQIRSRLERLLALLLGKWKRW